MRFKPIFLLCMSMLSCPHAQCAAPDTSAKTKVIAVLVGYETRITLSTGQQIEYFTPNPTNAFGDVFLFSVLVPTNLVDNFFIVQDRSGPMNRDPSRIFMFGTRYQFTIDTEILFNPSMHPHYTLVEPGVREAPVTREEVDAFASALDKDIERSKRMIIRMEKRLGGNLADIDRKRYVEYKTNEVRWVLSLETQKKKAYTLLNDAKDVYPDVIDLKWQALQEEGWNLIPRQADTNSRNQDSANKTNSQPSPACDFSNRAARSSEPHEEYR